MIDYHAFQQIHHLREKEKLTIAQIARSLGLHWQTVRTWAERPRYERRKAAAAARRASKLDPFKGAMARWLEQHPFTAAQLLTRIKAQGYTGSYSILKTYVATVRPQPAEAFLTLTFLPGQCAQVDWGSHGSVRVGNTRRALSFFVMVLCHSRRLYVEFTLGQSQEWWLGCHQRAFEFFHGVPEEIWCDNTKTAVLAHPRGGPVTLNPHYADFARHYGFTIKACGPHQPQQKGRVENAVAYVKKNFLAGLEITEFAPLNPALRVWLDTVANVRVHGETRQTPLARFAEEKLRALPAQPYDAALVKPAVRASNRWRVVVDTNRYSVPPAYASGQLTLKLYAERLRLFSGEQLVAEHVRSFERHRDIELPDHAAALHPHRPQARDQQLLLKFLALCPQAQAYHGQLGERRLNVRHHVQKIVALAEIFGPAATGRAITDAHELGAYSCEYIANLLEQRRRCLPEPGALHLTRQSDLLELELPAPDLSLYHTP
jgi:transposase